ncbi:MAG: hypothetical protein LBN95_08265 [Prevotellaceae bacterium]|nr:hypothetical protein [Prevotellaceae bacterium]
MRWAKITIGFQPKRLYIHCKFRLLPERQIDFSPMQSVAARWGDFSPMATPWGENQAPPRPSPQGRESRTLQKQTKLAKCNTPLSIWRGVGGEV